MKRLGTADAAFIHGETAAWHMHVPGLLILRSADGSTPDAEQLRRHLAARLVTIPQFRWRVVQVPLGLDRPSWVDADFDPLDHVQRYTLSAPGTLSQVFALAADLAEVKLDRSRPLWEFTVVDGLQDGAVAIVTKTHHALFDGMAGLALAAALYDPSPEPREVAYTEGLAGAETPAWQRTFAGALRTTAATPLRVGRLTTQLVRQGAVTVSSLAAGNALPALPTEAPRSPYNGQVTPRRAFVGHSVPLASLKAVRVAARVHLPQVSLNDVVLAVVGGALREHLRQSGTLPDKPLIASVPIDVRSSGHEAGGNDLSAGFVSLSTDLDDPRLRLQAIHEGMQRAKRAVAALMSQRSDGITAVAPPALVSALAWAYDAAGISDLVRPMGNVVVSSMPGPPVPLWIGGHRLESIYGMGPLLLSSGLNLTCVSHGDSFDIGITSCPDFVPGTAALPGLVDAALRDLLVAVT